MKSGPKQTSRREAARLLAGTAIVLFLILCAASVGFAPLWQTRSDLGGTVQDLDESVRVNLNKDGLHALCCLPGVGLSRAAAIMQYRAQFGPFSSPVDLEGIEGIDLATIVHWGNMAYTAEQAAEGS